jgi:hypothetical protein
MDKPEMTQAQRSQIIIALEESGVDHMYKI